MFAAGPYMFARQRGDPGDSHVAHGPEIRGSVPALAIRARHHTLMSSRLLDVTRETFLDTSPAGLDNLCRKLPIGGRRKRMDKLLHNMVERSTTLRNDLPRERNRRMSEVCLASWLSQRTDPACPGMRVGRRDDSPQDSWPAHNGHATGDRHHKLALPGRKATSPTTVALHVTLHCPSHAFESAEGKSGANDYNTHEHMVCIDAPVLTSSRMEQACNLCSCSTRLVKRNGEWHAWCMSETCRKGQRPAC